jgi:hypothetical protein
MTCPQAARTFYIVVFIAFFAGAVLLDLIGHFQYMAIVMVLIVAAGGWMSRVVFRCPVCRESVGRSKNGYYAPWIGPRCRYCESDLSRSKVSLQPSK